MYTIVGRPLCSMFQSPAAATPSTFVVLKNNRQARPYSNLWLETQPPVIQIWKKVVDAVPVG